MPIVGQGKYLFGSKDNIEQNGSFGTNLRNVFYTMCVAKRLRVDGCGLQPLYALTESVKMGKRRILHSERNTPRIWLIRDSLASNMRKLLLEMMIIPHVS